MTGRVFERQSGPLDFSQLFCILLFKIPDLFTMNNRTFKVINVRLELRRLALSRTRTFNASIQCLARSRLCNTRTSNASIQCLARSKLCYKNIQLPSPCHSLLSEAASATMFPHFQLHLHKRSDSIIDNWILINHWKVAAYPAPFWCWWKCKVDGFHYTVLMLKNRFHPYL